MSFYLFPLFFRVCISLRSSSEVLCREDETEGATVIGKTSTLRRVDTKKNKNKELERKRTFSFVFFREYTSCKNLVKITEKKTGKNRSKFRKKSLVSLHPQLRCSQPVQEFLLQSLLHVSLEYTRAVYEKSMSTSASQSRRK